MKVWICDTRLPAAAVYVIFYRLSLLITIFYIYLLVLMMLGNVLTCGSSR
jgi:hypothetical protein